MIYAYKLVKEGGVEALTEDMKRRNFLRAPMKFTAKQIKEFYDEISANLYNNMLTTVCYTLYELYGFEGCKLQEFKRAFDNNVGNALDLDYMGEHYVKLEDYAAELNEKFDMGIDISRVAMCQDSYDEKSENFRSCKVDRVVRELRDNGYTEAAEFLQEKLI